MDRQTVSLSNSSANAVRPMINDPEAIFPETFHFADLSQEQIDSVVHTLPGGAGNVQDIYPMTPLQEGMLFDCLLHSERDICIFSTLLEFESRAQVDAWTAALNRVIARHEVMRSAIVWKQVPRPLQVIYREARVPVRELELDRSRPSLEQLRERMSPGRQQLINLEQAPLAQMLVSSCEDESKWYTLLEIHHLVSDLQSLKVLVSEALAILDNRVDDLPTPEDYRSYVASQLKYAQADEVQARAFFSRKLHSIEESCAPFGIPELNGNRVEQASDAIEGALEQQIRRTARRLGVSPARLFHSALGMVVAYTSCSENALFGTIVSVTQHGGGVPRLLGLTVNTLPLRLSLTGLTAESLVKHTHEELKEVLNNVHAPLALAKSSAGGFAGRGPLFTTLFNFRRSRHETEWDSFAGTRVIARGEAPTSYPILISVDDRDQVFVMTAQADQRIGPDRVLGYLRTALEALVEALEQGSQTPVLELRILPESERRLILGTFNSTQALTPCEKLIHELIEDQVKLTPEDIAVVYESQSLTYSDLNRSANQLAHRLMDLGVGPDVPVGICAERSLELIVGLLGILKAGGAYVPMDPGYPAERLTYILNDAKPKVLLTQGHLKARLPATTFPVVVLDESWADLQRQSTDNIDSRSEGLTAGNLAYIIYTSGSTGQPKGAMNEHKGVVNRLLWMQAAYQLDQSDRVLQKTPFSFDVSVWEFFWPLMTGARLIVARPQGHMDPAYLATLIEHTGVTTAHFVPSMLQIFLEQHRAGSCGSLRHIVCSGEELSVVLQNRCLENLAGVRLSNLYGPTEAAVDVTSWECKKEDGAARVPIGRPISNVRIYVCNSRLEPVPVGVIGDIYIGGIAVGRGYVNRPDLTADRFIRDPFDPDAEARMYKTGDLGRWREDGAVEYFGRNDFQVKIRGFRIELGEIEAHLRQHDLVREAVVIAVDDVSGEKRLVAYVIGRSIETAAGVIDAKRTEHAGVIARDTAQGMIPTLRQYLEQRLPEHMVPSAWMVLEAFPLSPNGKLDRRALPAPPSRTEGMGVLVTARTNVERVLAGIWSQVLKADQVGIDDNFFELGGHSLLATRVISRVQDALNIELTIRALFDAPTVRKLAAHIEMDEMPQPEICSASVENDLRREIDQMDDDEVFAQIARLERESSSESTVRRD